jgi:type VI secretion system protein VasI
MVRIPSIMGVAFLASLVGAISSTKAQEDVATRLYNCTEVRSDVDRLRCYDTAFGSRTSQSIRPDASLRVPGQPLVPSLPQVDSRKPAVNSDLSLDDGQAGWLNRETNSGLDNGKIETAILPATVASISRIHGPAQRAALIIRCRESKTDLFVVYSDVVDGMEHSIRVQYRIGNRPIKSESWGISQDCTSYGTWQTPATIPFIKSLLYADDFYVRGNAGSMGTSEASFKLVGIQEAIAPVRNACHW